VPLIRLADRQSLLHKAFLLEERRRVAVKMLTDANRTLFFKTVDEYREVYALAWQHPSSLNHSVAILRQRLPQQLSRWLYNKVMKQSSWRFPLNI
jgi:hypothetical protein